MVTDDTFWPAVLGDTTARIKVRLIKYKGGTILIHKGERVIDEEGNHVCTAARDIEINERAGAPGQFADWQILEPQHGEEYPPGFRYTTGGRVQTCIEGEWRP